MTNTNNTNDITNMADTPDVFTMLTSTAAAGGPTAMFAALAESLKARQRWHALFDLRLLQARAALGLPTTGDVGTLDPATRDRLDEQSLAACREVGWPLLDEGHVAAGWMYLRAAAEPAEVADKLAALLLRDAPSADDEAAAARLQEIIQIALWEGIDPALGLSAVLASQGTCNSITAYEQAVSRLPAARQQQPAGVLLNHLFRELFQSLAADLERRGLVPAETIAGTTSIAELLAAGGGLKDDPSFHVDVSHLQSVLRIARVCTDRPTIEKAWELAVYGCRLPEEVTYPGEAPFENVAEASRLFYGALLGRRRGPAVFPPRRGDRAGRGIGHAARRHARLPAVAAGPAGRGLARRARATGGERNAERHADQRHAAVTGGTRQTGQRPRHAPRRLSQPRRRDHVRRNVHQVGQASACQSHRPAQHS